MNSIHERIWISEAAFKSWLQKSAVGAVIGYHRGFLAIDTDAATSPLSSEERLRLIATATAAYRAAEDGAVHLLQRRLGSHCFSYIAVRRGSRRHDTRIDEPRDADLATDPQVRHLLARFAISRPLAIVIAEHAFGLGRRA